jgi:hypothetical protein
VVEQDDEVHGDEDGQVIMIMVMMVIKVIKCSNLEKRNKKNKMGSRQRYIL